MSLRDHDQRWDELALGHVLGGLADPDASAFRGHLAACPQCRARVAELRSLDSEMAAAEREEQAARRLRLRIESRVEENHRDRPPPPPSSHWRSIVASGVAVILLMGLFFWNADLRAENTELHRAADLQERTLEAMGKGTTLPVTTSGVVTGTVSADGNQVAYSLSGIPRPDPGERLVVWLELRDTTLPVAVYRPSQLQDGWLASTVDVPPRARSLLITIEAAAVPARPAGTHVLEAPLDAISEPALDPSSEPALDPSSEPALDPSSEPARDPSSAG